VVCISLKFPIQSAVLCSIVTIDRAIAGAKYDAIVDD